jgi:hypothetical protein
MTATTHWDCYHLLVGQLERYGGCRRREPRRLAGPAAEVTVHVVQSEAINTATPGAAEEGGSPWQWQRDELRPTAARYPTAPAVGRARPASRARAARRRWSWLVVPLVVGCALGFADASLRLASHGDVLAVSQPLAAGQVLVPGDLRAVPVSTRPARGSGSGVASSRGRSICVSPRGASWPAHSVVWCKQPVACSARHCTVAACPG